MFNYLFAFIVLIHGVIHFMGFAKAFGYGNMTQLTQEISKPAGLAWLLTGLLFIIAVVLFLLKIDAWAMMAVVPVFISQILILQSWKDAKYGTIINVMALVMAVAVIFW